MIQLQRLWDNNFLRYDMKNTGNNSKNRSGRSDAMVRPLLGMPASATRMSDYKVSPVSPIQLPANKQPGTTSDSPRVQALCHPRGRAGWSPGLLILAWCSPSCWGANQQMLRVHSFILFLSHTLCFSFPFQLSILTVTMAFK